MRQINNFTPQALLRGVFFCLAIILLPSCDKPPESPDWPSHSESTEPQAATGLPTLPLSSVINTDVETTFMVYNIKNYLSQPRGETIQSKPKDEIKDLIDNILEVQPDILGICEIGTNADLKDLQQRLKNHGLHLPHSHLMGGADAYRRQAILSKFPLKAYDTAKIEFTYNSARHIILRGILDVSINLPGGETRFVGAHLKSKRENKYFDQALIRRNEAQLVRQHVDLILESTPDLIVYGDFNDTKQSPSVRAIAGDHGSLNYLSPLNLTDSNGQKWTHYWGYQDIYSRFDYAFVSQSMKSRIDMKQSYILNIPQENQASDHRPLVITIY
ncbi:endonuclease/exonuclease/phosphatase family protein [Rubritalea spongiae]|uniref:Endonuclease/exonuclease/phosphatase family protein n=1 Tax=Rubritalea spongiae TaxID=430797 RepID=A0ABW5E4R2_9BACT